MLMRQGLGLLPTNRHRSPTTDRSSTRCAPRATACMAPEPSRRSRRTSARQPTACSTEMPRRHRSHTCRGAAESLFPPDCSNMLLDTCSMEPAAAGRSTFTTALGGAVDAVRFPVPYTGAKSPASPQMTQPQAARMDQRPGKTGAAGPAGGGQGVGRTLQSPWRWSFVTNLSNVGKPITNSITQEFSDRSAGQTANAGQAAHHDEEAAQRRRSGEGRLPGLQLRPPQQPQRQQRPRHQHHTCSQQPNAGDAGCLSAGCSASRLAYTPWQGLYTWLVCESLQGLARTPVCGGKLQHA